MFSSITMFAINIPESVQQTIIMWIFISCVVLAAALIGVVILSIFSAAAVNIFRIVLLVLVLVAMLAAAGAGYIYFSA